MALPSRRYTPAEIAEGLAVLAEVKHLDAAVDRLKTLWADAPSKNTLQRWKGTHAQAWENAQLTVRERRDTRINESRHLIIEKSSAIVLEGLNRIQENLEGYDPKDLPAMVKAVTVTMAVAFDKELLARGMPTSVVEHRKTGEEVLRSLKAMGMVVESTAEED